MPKNRLPKVVIEFKPDPDFEEQFRDFIDEVLLWPKEKSNQQKNGKSKKFNNRRSPNN